jgi:hypothetical protein
MDDEREDGEDDYERRKPLGEKDFAKIVTWQPSLAALAVFGEILTTEADDQRSKILVTTGVTAKRKTRHGRGRTKTTGAHGVSVRCMDAAGSGRTVSVLIQWPMLCPVELRARPRRSIAALCPERV